MSTNVVGFIEYSRKITNIFCILILVKKVDLMQSLGRVNWL
jgi:hypothetical protein